MSAHEESRERPIDPVAAAICWAMDAHDGQHYPGLGYRPPQPYIRHVLRVVLAVGGEVAQVVAALHDVLEDTDTGLPQWLTDVEVKAVDLLTWWDDPDNYGGYIDRIATADGEAGEIARAVKLADLTTNLEHDPDGILRERERYEAARWRLWTAGVAPEPQR